MSSMSGHQVPVAETKIAKIYSKSNYCHINRKNVFEHWHKKNFSVVQMSWNRLAASNKRIVYLLSRACQPAVNKLPLRRHIGTSKSQQDVNEYSKGWEIAGAVAAVVFKLMKQV